MTDETTDGASEASATDHDERETLDGWDQSSKPSVAIPEAVAAATERDPTAVPSLHRSVDTDSLDRLLTGETQQGGAVRVSFTYDGHRVSAGSDGSLSIQADGSTHESGTAAPETSADLETALQTVFRAAYRNGVSVTGGYGLRNDSELPDWDIHVTEVEKPSDDA